MRITNDATFNEHPITGGSQPNLIWGTDRPATTSTFSEQPIGTLYVCAPQAGVRELWQKLFDTNNIDDWRCVHGVLSETLTRASMTDGGATTGTKVLVADLPAGARVYGSSISGITGFIGDTSAVATIGDGTDVDRYNTGTTNVFTTGQFPTTNPHNGLPSGVMGHIAAMETITVTVTSAVDFTNVSAGQMTVSLFYLV